MRIKRPFALDLFCCGGGASKGLVDAGFNVVGIDIEPQRHYPYAFMRHDAMTLDDDYIASFDLVWSSPPCQAYTRNAKQKATAHQHPDLIDPIRQKLSNVGVPFVIENVDSAPLRSDLMLCGSMFDLKLVRHRLFELYGFKAEQPQHGEHHPDYVIVAGHTGGSSKRDTNAHFGNLDQWKEAMQIDWLPSRKLKEAIPPAYSRYIAQAALEYL